MILINGASAKPAGSFPRRCGGDPFPVELVDNKMIVFPAGAGVILSYIVVVGDKMGFPRRCGGDPAGNTYTQAPEMFSPQVRG